MWAHGRLLSVGTGGVHSEVTPAMPSHLLAQRA